MDIQIMSQQLSALAVLRGLRQDETLRAFEATLHTKTAEELFSAVGTFAASLFEHTTNWSDYVVKLVLESENCCIRQAATTAPNGVLQTALDKELALFQAISTCTLADVCPEHDFLPSWETTQYDLPALYAQRMAQVHQKGYGMFAKYHVFTVENGALQPVRHPDPQRLEQLTGYEAEQRKVVANTEALLAGKPANNVLLYGDAGTGKSSAVKAIANLYAEQGLRLVEVKKNQLYQIPALMEKLAANPLKFILFIDDLSFTANDDNFAALKAILEGSVCGQAGNIAVYATSNRRHLVKETLSDRTGDDIHESDTRQELMSLSARFGLTITFLQPERAKYEAIVRALAAEYAIPESTDRLLIRAHAFALRSGGRSPRVAKQFIQLCKAGVV